MNVDQVNESSGALTAFPAVADVDLDAIGHNLRLVAGEVGSAGVLGVVKADAYGHGRAQCAGAMLAAGADYLGVAQLAEALDLRREVGPGPRILTWIHAPGAPLDAALRADLEISVGAPWAIEELAAAVRATGITARVHLKVDTGMARGGIDLWNLAAAAERIRAHVAEGVFDVVALWSHLARADEPDCGLTEIQIGRFEEARGIVEAAGLDVQICHLAASAGALWHPAARYDMVRPGIALYGISPNPAHMTASQIGLRAAMTLSAELIVDREVPGGTGVSYGHTARTERPTRLGVVPLGYADGIDRKASNAAPLVINGHRTTIVGRVCMDQFVSELPPGTKAGDRAWLFGDAREGLATADDWAEASETIGYEVVTRLGARVPRRHHGTGAAKKEDGMELIVPEADDMRRVGEVLGTVLRGGDLVMLDGPLGAGKTTLTQGIAVGMNVGGRVASPTFVIAQVHKAKGGGPELVHVDAYRLSSLDELDALDLDASLADSATVVEWGEGKVEILTPDRLTIRIIRPEGSNAGEQVDDLSVDASRTLRIEGSGPRGQEIVERLRELL